MVIKNAERLILPNQSVIQMECVLKVCFMLWIYSLTVPPALFCSGLNANCQQGPTIVLTYVKYGLSIKNLRLECVFFLGSYNFFFPLTLKTSLSWFILNDHTLQDFQELILIWHDRLTSMKILFRLNLCRCTKSVSEDFILDILDLFC